MPQATLLIPLFLVLPIAAPGVTATVIRSLIFAWNEYLFAIVFASGVLIVLPVAVAALLLQRYFVRGLTLGAFK